MDYVQMTAQLRKIALRLLESGNVCAVWGFCDNEETGTASPFAAKTADDAQRLVWNKGCFNILLSLMPKNAEKLAIAAKPCEVRALINLIAEKQLERSGIYIIGMKCEGMEKRGRMSSSCLRCTQTIPAVYDELIDGGSVGIKNEAEDITKWLDGTTPAQRRKRLQRELDKCVLCYSCRQACPGCRCEVCFVDRSGVNWRAPDDRTEKLTYHLTRAMHLAGRCADCGACENACPSGVSIKYLTDGLSEFVRSEYGFTAGENMESAGVFNTALTDDKETGFWQDGGDAR